MAVTPKPVRRNGNSCICPDSADRLVNNYYVLGTCRIGCCAVLRCTACRGELCGWGPVGCKCQRSPRWLRYPAMREPGKISADTGKHTVGRAAVKPSLPKFKRDLAGSR